jgi:tRNA A37 threonylcarbamoyladenosine dehydratase
MTIVDGDVVDPSNRNRQLPALSSTHGVSKADLMAERLLDINPNLKLHVRKDFLDPEKAEEITSEPYDYIVDAIDSLTPKLNLLASAHRRGQRIVSSMGAGGKMDPTKIRITDVFMTQICPFALMVRKRLKKLGLTGGFLAVYSFEHVNYDSLMLTDGSNYKKSAYGTISYLPAAFGGACASVVIRGLLGLPIDREDREPGAKKEIKRRRLQRFNSK